jgi:multiple sugar transport system substrate-binding protein
MVNELYGYYQEGLFRTKNTLPNQANTSNYFVDGQMAMTIGSTGGTSYNDTLNFTPLPALPPHVDGKTLQVVNQGPSICVFSRATQKERYAAWLFYKYVTRSYNSAAFAVSSTGYDPVRESSFSQQVYLDWLSDNPNGIQQRTAVVTSSLRDKYFSSPVFVGSSKARVQVGNIFGNVFNGSKTVDAAFDYAINQCING